MLTVQLSIAEQDQHPEPKRLWEHSELKNLIHFDSTMVRPPMVGYSVMFANDANVDGQLSFACSNQRLIR